MKIRFHPHALQRMNERGASRGEVTQTIATGIARQAKFGRTSFSKSFAAPVVWMTISYRGKRIEAYAAKKSDGWLVITVIVKYLK